MRMFLLGLAGALALLGAPAAAQTVPAVNANMNCAAGQVLANVNGSLGCISVPTASDVASLQALIPQPATAAPAAGGARLGRVAGQL